MTKIRQNSPPNRLWSPPTHSKPTSIDFIYNMGPLPHHPDLKPTALHRNLGFSTTPMPKKVTNSTSATSNSTAQVVDSQLVSRAVVMHGRAGPARESRLIGLSTCVYFCFDVVQYCMLSLYMAECHVGEYEPTLSEWSPFWGTCSATASRASTLTRLRCVQCYGADIKHIS